MFCFVFYLTIKIKSRAAELSLQKVKENQITLELIRSPFGYLRYLGPKLLVGMRKQTSKQRQLE